MWLCISAASERHDDVSESEMHAGSSGGINPLLDPEPKSEVGTETDLWEVAEPEVTPLTRNHFGVVVNGEGELQEKKGTFIVYCREYFYQNSSTDKK